MSIQNQDTWQQFNFVAKKFKRERARLKCRVHEDAFAERHVVRNRFGLIEEKIGNWRDQLVGDDGIRKLDLHVGDTKCWLINNDCRRSGGAVCECHLPRTFSGASILYEVINEYVANKRNDERDDEMFGWILALH